jgi:hypothetical protein
MAEELNISELLRKKRYEEPPPEYFDQFLRDFRRRQRAELIQRPTWAIVWERIMALAPGFRVPQVAYAAIAVLAVSASTLLLVRQPGSAQGVVAVAEAPATTFSLTTAKPVTIGETRTVSTRPNGSLPSHYVLQSRPVSNEKPLSF